VCLVVLEPVEILVPLLTDIALVRLLFLHALGSRVGCLSVRIDNREGAIPVLMQSLTIVTVLVCR